MVSSVIFWVFVIAVAEQMMHFMYFFIRIFSLPAQSVHIPIDSRKPVSVVICARNEALHLWDNLPAILKQSYNDKNGLPMFEVVVVNDRSDDDTSNILSELKEDYNHLVVVTINEAGSNGLTGKKNALYQGVIASNNDFLVFTDADCIPASDKWIENMVRPLLHGKEIVAGYGGYNKTSGLLNQFIRWETMHTFLLYSTYVLAKIPYMAVGRNMACTKEVFLKASETALWKKLPYGDDDMLIAVAATDTNMAIVCNEQAFTYSEPMDTWQDWIAQKQRHLSTGKYYKLRLKLLLSEYALTHALMWVTFFASFFYFGLANAIVLIMAVRCIMYWGVWAFAAIRLKEKKLIYLFPLFDLGWMIYNFVCSPYIFFKNKKSWK